MQESFYRCAPGCGGYKGRQHDLASWAFIFLRDSLHKEKSQNRDKHIHLLHKKNKK